MPRKKKLQIFELKKKRGCGGPRCDTVYHFLIRAFDEIDARKLAQHGGFDECFDYSIPPFCDRKPMSFWTDPDKTSCEVISCEGDRGIILYESYDG
tara:strand:- start:2719 stop:3006 length:288 start_codon:yes stop_codon:yes gene_type:complete